jgi:AcrR family transcriptional regulator
MKQRKKQPEQTRQAILDAAGAGLCLHGYSGTGLGAIVSRAELTKGALFHHFADKRSLVAAWIGESLTAAIQGIWIAPLETIGSLQSLRAYCHSRCLELQPGDATSALISLTAETAAADPVLGDALEDIFVSWRTGIAEMLERGKSEGWIHRSILPAVEAAFLVSAFAGFAVTTQRNPDDAGRRVCATALEGYLETLRSQ